jgi:hypothetical protein
MLAFVAAKDGEAWYNAISLATRLGVRARPAQIKSPQIKYVTA